jgi:dihydroxy-acid dehydratase
MKDLKARSNLVYGGIEKAPNRAFLKAVGLSDSDIGKPLVGVATTWDSYGQ